MPDLPKFLNAQSALTADNKRRPWFTPRALEASLYVNALYDQTIALVAMVDELCKNT